MPKNKTGLSEVQKLAPQCCKDYKAFLGRCLPRPCVSSAWAGPCSLHLLTNWQTCTTAVTLMWHKPIKCPEGASAYMRSRRAGLAEPGWSSLAGLVMPVAGCGLRVRVSTEVFEQYWPHPWVSLILRAHTGAWAPLLRNHRWRQLRNKTASSKTQWNPTATKRSRFNLKCTGT